MASNSSGFTLLEVIIAMAIMVVAFGAIIAVEGGSVNASARAKQMAVVGVLAKNKMIETEYKIQGKPFDEIRKEETGAFEQPYQQYKWKVAVKELKFPQLGAHGGGSGSGSGSGSGGGETQSADMLTKLISTFLSKAIREVSVTITWKKGPKDQTFSLSTYWVNLNHEFSLSE